MKRLSKVTIGILGILMLAAPMILYAQITTGTLRGFVTEKQGEPLPGVTIEIESPNLMSPRSAITDARGAYRFLYLPPGTYTICAKLEGFGTCWKKGVPVQAAKTYTADIEMEMAGLEETIVVTAEAPVIDKESSDKSYNLSIEMLATVPISPRISFKDVWETLPGVISGWGESPLVNAGSVTHNLEPGKTYMWDHHNQDDCYENKVMIDGMEVNDSMSGTSYAQFNYEAIQEMDVKTAGASAEYGNARSAFMNVITKSGGNDFHGSFLFQYQPESLVTTNIEGGTPQKISYAIPAITLSGPIMKDRIWFLASYKYDNEDYQYPDTIVEPELIRETRSHMPFAKLTFQLHKSHTVSIVYQDDYTEIQPYSLPSSKYSTYEAGGRAQRGGPMVSGTWRWIISDSLYFNFVAGYNHKPRETYSITDSPRYRYTERFQGGSTVKYDKGRGEEYYSVRENLLFSGHLTHFIDDLWNTGSHEIKYGVDIRPYQHVTRTRKYNEDEYGFYRYRLGMDYANYGLNEPYIYRAYARTPGDRYDNEVLVSNQNVYIQDSWVINKNLTIQLGVRWEHQRENMYFRDELPAWMDEIYSDMRNNIEFDDSGFAPRLGLAYNWEKVGIFKLHFGRYFEYVGTGDYNNYSRTITTDQYRMDKADIGKGPEALKLYTEGTLGHNPDYNKDMEMEYNDEFLFSFERELFANLAFETTFVYRNIATSYMEDINAIFENGQFVGRKFPTFDTIWQRTFYKGDDKRWKFDYKGLQFNLRKNFVGRWGLMVNYSLMWRNYRKLKFDPTDPLQFVYTSPSCLDMENYGRRWSFHLTAFYRLPWDILVSTFVNGQSGIWMNDRTGDYAWDDSAPRITLSNGRRVRDIVWQAKNNYFVGEKWGEHGRYTDQLWEINVRLAKGVRISRVRVEVALDVFNVFNWAVYSSFETLDIRRTDRYDIKTGPQSPRSGQLTLKIEF